MLVQLCSRLVVTQVLFVRSDTVDAERGRARGQGLPTDLPPPPRLPRQLHLGDGRLHRLEVPEQVNHRQPLSSRLLHHQGEHNPYKLSLTATYVPPYLRPHCLAYDSRA